MIIDKLINPVRSSGRMSNGILRMSLLEGCPRREGYEYLGYKHDVEFSSGPMYEGNIHEADIISRLQEAGYRVWNYGENQTYGILTSRGLKFRGHPDTFIEIESKNYGLEIKSARGEVWEKYAQGASKIVEGFYSQSDYILFTQRPWPYMGQIQMYLHSDVAEQQGVEEWILIIKNRNTGELLECIIPKIPDYVDKLVAKWKPFWPLVQSGRLPERFFNDDSSECSHCNFQTTCWGVLRKLPKDTVEDPTLERAVEFRRLGVQLKKESEELLDEARRQFLNSHIRNEADHITCNGLTSTVSNRARIGYWVPATEYQEVRFKDEHPRPKG